jgi:hypothetical protein
MTTSKFSVSKEPCRNSRDNKVEERVNVGFIKSVMGLGGVEKVGDRILGELEAARNRGEERLWVGYTQSEIGIRGNATQMAVFIRRKIEKRGFEVIEGEGGSFGDDVRLLVRCGA